jgi:site-specific DNA-cytosine methylase
MLFKDFVGWEAAIAHLPKPQVYELSHRMAAMVPEGFTGRLLASGWHQYTGRGRAGLTLRRPNEPAATLTAKASQPSLRPMIVEWRYDVEARVLDVPHLAALQSFPSDYNWGDNPTTAIAAIGNSVAPLLMQKIVEANWDAA